MFLNSTYASYLTSSVDQRCGHEVPGCSDSVSHKAAIKMLARIEISSGGFTKERVISNLNQMSAQLISLQLYY